MLELLALLLNASRRCSSPYSGSEPRASLCLRKLIRYDQRGLLKAPVSVADLRLCCGRYQADFGVIAKDLLPAHTWDALATGGGEVGWYGSLGA